MNVQNSARLHSKGRPTYRKVYHADGTTTEVTNPKPNSGFHAAERTWGAVIIKGVPDEFRGYTADRFSAAPGVSFEQAAESGT